MSLTELQIIEIENQLQQDGLHYAPLQDELLDHCCCLIEEQLGQGSSFHEAFNHAMDAMGSDVIQKCQKETKFLLNQKQQIMKRITLATCGIAASCFLITTILAAQEIPTVMPLEDFRISSSFGKRLHPITKQLKQHKGIDLVASKGTPVMATADGTVITVIEDPDGHGKYIVVQHTRNYRTKYAQLSEFKVNVGSKVTKGQTIGLVGSSGVSTAPHLHYEVLKDGIPIDPFLLIEDS